MTNWLKSMLVSTAAVISLMAGADQVLYWMVDDPTIKCGDDSFKASEAATYGKTIDSARVAAFETQYADRYAAQDRTGYDIIYLDLYYQNDAGQWVVDPTASPRIDTVGLTDGSMDAYARASIGSTLGDAYASYSFAVELGTWTGDDASDWLLAAMSGSETYANLTEYISSQVAVPTSVPWQTDSYSVVPEPSSGLLILIGGALMALRRRRSV